jgi:hypothetical protein
LGWLETSVRTGYTQPVLVIRLNRLAGLLN